jgi:hypothetical protein
MAFLRKFGRALRAAWRAFVQSWRGENLREFKIVRGARVSFYGSMQEWKAAIASDKRAAKPGEAFLDGAIRDRW